MRNPESPSVEQCRWLAEQLGAERLHRQVPLADKTSFGIGGAANLYYEASTPEELAAAVTLARRAAVDFFVLGAGANILVGDLGFAGLVIANRARHLSVSGQRLTADSGALIHPNVIEQAVAHQLSGLEHYAGIPSTVGGALWQNLHFLSPAPTRARTMFIEEVLESATLLTAEGERQTVDVDYFQFGYDDSILHHRNDIVLTATFALALSDATRLKTVVAENLDWRKARHPPLDSEPSAGSIFRKIEGIGAGRLIDEAGLKGMLHGGIQISPRHANILVNRGGGTAAEVGAMIMHIQQSVHQQTGHWLVPEISLVGNFSPIRKIRDDKGT